MTRDEHERERRAFWDACCAATLAITEADAAADPTDQHIYEAAYCARLADAKLAERDKRWPAPEVPRVPCVPRGGWREKQIAERAGRNP